MARKIHHPSVNRDDDLWFSKAVRRTIIDRGMDARTMTPHEVLREVETTGITDGSVKKIRALLRRLRRQRRLWR